MRIKFVPQHDQMDCGPAAIAMIARFYGKKYSLQYLREHSFITKEGVSVAGISHASEKIGLNPFVIQLSIPHLKSDNDFPCILHWNQNHFVVLYKIKRKFFSKKTFFEIADPGHGLVSLNEDDFQRKWVSNENKGVAIFLKPIPEFYLRSDDKRKRRDFGYILKHLKPFKWQLLQVIAALLATSAITLIFPFLTQAVIDKGIGSKSLQIVFILLLAQIFLFLGSTVIDTIRNWIALYLGTRINIQIISDFLGKILRLPLVFFDTKMKGDFNQRIQDQVRIENFLTTQSLITLFSLINFGVFFFVLFYYDIKIVSIYTLLTTLAIAWSVLFLKKGKILDYYRFQRRSENQESIYELINGIQEIKLNNFEDYKRKNWEGIQVKLFGVNVRVLRNDRLQMTGFDFINQFKNIIVTFIAASEVIKGNITLGAMLSVAYIIGQMNSPVNQLISFFRSFQEAKLSLERLNEVHEQQDEEKPHQISIECMSQKEMPININSLSFQYGGPNSAFVFKNLSICLPVGKTTAIVGSSGSGKTTLMKILLKFYQPTSGFISVGNQNLESISAKSWRNQCGVVMQDGHIFSDTIVRNIICGDENIDRDRLDDAIRISNINSFIERLPLGLNTKIGASGVGISGGQKQRILIARAIYKNPSYIMFDEATSALDAENEKVIHNNLVNFFSGKTVLIIAHRLSTVRDADQIIVLKNGEIVEIGSHLQLVSNKSEYFNLVKNQLELGG